MSKKVGKVTNMFAKAKQLISEQRFDEARDTLDTCLLVLAIDAENGVEKVDNVKIDLWKDRVWLLLEEKQLLY